MIGSLLKRLGELALDMDLIYTRIVLSVYNEFSSKLNQEECRLYAFRIFFSVVQSLPRVYRESYLLLLRK